MSTPTPSALTLRRRRAVELRLAGHSLADIQLETGLSVPTVIRAYRGFLAAGWAGIAAAPRGRRRGQGGRLTALQEADLHNRLLHTLPDNPPGLWTPARASDLALQLWGVQLTGRALSRCLERAGLALVAWPEASAAPAHEAWRSADLVRWLRQARSGKRSLLWCGPLRLQAGDQPAQHLLACQTLRGSTAWMPLSWPPQEQDLTLALQRVAITWPGPLTVLLHGPATPWPPALQARASADGSVRLHPCPVAQARHASPPADVPAAATPSVPTHTAMRPARKPDTMRLTHLQRLEAESFQIMREVVAECERPVMLYSVGKDSATMLHLARKAFYPAPPPFPLLHVDTTWKFRDMYTLRDRMAQESGMDLLVWHNPEAQAMGINPFDHGSQIHTDMWKTQGLKQALDHHGFDAAFGGARRDEEKSRAKERIFSFRSTQHRWDPKSQRPELWSLYNARKRPGESIRVFPLSNWTELDIWQYIYLENIPIVPLYFARERPVVERNGTLLMVDDERFRLEPGEVPMMRKVRFRTLGCYPLSGAIESEADNLSAIIQEMLLARTSERQGRMIDHDQSASMEKKKQEGYF